MRLLASEYFSADGVALPGKVSELEGFIIRAKELDPDFRCYPDVLDYISETKDSDYRKGFLSKLTDKDLDGLLKTSLYPYQKEGVPVLQALDLVHDDTFGEHLPFQAHVPVHSVVGDYLVEHVRLVHLGALDRIALYHQGGRVREFLDLFLPLVLKRRGTDDEYGRHQPGLRAFGYAAGEQA